MDIEVVPTHLKVDLKYFDKYESNYCKHPKIGFVVVVATDNYDSLVTIDKMLNKMNKEGLL